MTAIGTFVPFEVHVSEELPCVVVRHLFLIADSQFKTVLIEKPGTYLNTTVLVGGRRRASHCQDSYGKQ